MKFSLNKNGQKEVLYWFYLVLSVLFSPAEWPCIMLRLVSDDWESRETESGANWGVPAPERRTLPSVERTLWGREELGGELCWEREGLWQVCLKGSGRPDTWMGFCCCCWSSFSCLLSNRCWATRCLYSLFWLGVLVRLLAGL